MYNLIVTAHDGAWHEPHFAIEFGRYLEHTQPELKERFGNLDDGVVAELKRLPTVFAPLDPARAQGD